MLIQNDCASMKELIAKYRSQNPADHSGTNTLSLASPSHPHVQ
jgi:hypothetical protein